MEINCKLSQEILAGFWQYIAYRTSILSVFKLVSKLVQSFCKVCYTTENSVYVYMYVKRTMKNPNFQMLHVKLVVGNGFTRHTHLAQPKEISTPEIFYTTQKN